MKKLLLNVILLLCSLVCGDMSDVVSILSVTVTPSSGIVGIGDSVVATVKASVEVRFFSFANASDVKRTYNTGIERCG